MRPVLHLQSVWVVRYPSMKRYLCWRDGWETTSFAGNAAMFTNSAVATKVAQHLDEPAAGLYWQVEQVAVDMPTIKAVTDG